MKRKDRLFSEIYKIDESTGRYMIEIALDQYADIFNEWDPAPFKRRDIDPDLQQYLEESANEIYTHYAIELCFTIPKAIRDERIETECRDGFKNSLIYKIYFLRKELKKTNTRMLVFAFIGFVFLGVVTTFSDHLTTGVLPSILVQGLSISGWVFIWEAVSLFFFSNRELYHRYKTYKRLQTAPMIFRDAEELG